MRIVSFRKDGAVRLGFEQGDVIVDARAALPAGDPAQTHLADTIAFIRAGADGLALARRILADAPAAARLPKGSVKLAAPMMPSTILCSGSNYHAHNAEKLNTAISGKEPEFFIKTSDCVVGPEESIIHDPAVTKKMDCETELAVVIGKPGRHIAVENALDHVFGYTICNDVTARDRQVRKTASGDTFYELGSGKAFNSSAPLGPCIVTADEIPDPQNLMLRTRINGDLRQQSSTGDMIWSCAQLIHFFSNNFTLKPGMVIITGTPAGTAWSMDAELGGKWQSLPGLVPAKRYCLPGDVIECEMEGIGVLKNTVAAA